MTFGRLLLRNLFYHWRGNCAVFLGVAVGTAVLTGALLVGDSLRGSLRDLTLQQLGWVDQALTASRFFRAEVAGELHAESISPALLLQGTITTTGHTQTGALPLARRANRVTILGVDDRFWHEGKASAADPFWNSSKAEVALSAALAEELALRPGDEVVIHLQKVSAVPRETLLGHRDAGAVLDEFKVTVREVLPERDFGSRFNLSPSPEAPRNAFLPLHALQTKLGVPGRVNALLVAGGSDALQAELGQHLTLDDWNLVLRDPDSRTKALFDKLDRDGEGKLRRSAWQGRVAERMAREADQNHDGILDRDEVLAYYRRQHPYLSLESRQLILEPAVTRAAEVAAKEAGLRAAPTLVYLANSIADGKEAIPYSIVAALDPALPPPLGPFLPPGVERLQDDEIILVDWPDSPLRAQPGDRITLTFFEPEEQGQPKEQSAAFRLRGRLALSGPADDADLTPEFPGITDKLTLDKWDPPFPYHNERVKPRDERYWKEYRTTPKAYVTLAAGQRLWSSRFGQLTSVRLAPADGDLNAAAAAFRQRLLQHLSPEQGGLVFDPVRQHRLEASAGGTDFSGLFLGFSCFLIAAALLLVGLLFRLNLDRRAAEVGILLATGYRRGTVRWLLLAEGGVLAAVGGLVGLVGAALYAWLLLELLAAWWPGLMERSFLRLHVGPTSLIYGYAAALGVSLLTILWAVWALGRVAPRALLAGDTTVERQQTTARQPPRWSRWVALASAVAAVGLLLAGGFVQDHEMRASSFFGGGTLLLVAALAGAWAWMRGERHGLVRGQGGTALARLGVRNAARHPVRSLLTAGLLASSAFLIVAVESFRRQPDRNYLDKNSGSGGFALLAESDLPIYQDLNSSKGQEEIADRIEQQLRSRPGVEPEQVQKQLSAARATLAGVSFYPFRVRAGDDASCLNLYQPRRPRLLGVPPRLVERGGFQFADTEATTAEERANPWTLLDRPRDDGAVPVFGEENTVVWMLKSGLGKELTVPDERGEPVRLRIVGLLKDSVFQSGLLLSEANFLKLYPRQEGYGFFLIETPPDHSAAVADLLGTALADRGFEVTPTAMRLAAYLAVENTYLSTFQALGGLGLLLGALGLAVVLLRSVWERRGELALLRALGYRRSALAWLVLSENSFLLVLGLAAGTAAALLSVAPHLTAGAGEVPWLRLAGLLALVLAVGLAAGALAVAASLRAPLLLALRRE